MKSRMIGLLLALTLVFGLLTMVIPVEAEENIISDASLQARIDELYNLLGEKYFNVHQNTDCGPKSSRHGCSNCDTANIVNAAWFKEQFGTVSTSQFVSSGQSCVGFAWFAGWYIFRANDSDSVNRDAVGTFSNNFETVSANAHLGDYFYLNGHAGIYLGCNSSGIQVLDCNWGGPAYNCMVQKHTIPYSYSSTIYFARFYSTTNGRMNRESNNASVDTSATVTPGFYYIEAYCGKVVEVENSGQSNGANIQIWENVGIDCQKFNIEKIGNYYTLTASHSGKVMDIAGGSSQSGTNIQQYTFNGSNAQKWQFIDAGGGYYYIRSALGTYMDVYYENTSNGTNVWAYSFNGSNAQKFRLVPENNVVAWTAPINTQTYNGHTYELYDYSLTWENAKQFCDDKGGHLVTITSQNEQNFINSFLIGSKNLYYIGLQKVSGNWNWVTGESFSYTNWTVNEPSNNNEPYVQLYAKYYKDHQIGSWNDTVNGGSTSVEYYALSNIGFICEYEPQEQYYLDVNGILDGVKADNVVEYGTFDVYINGALVADDISDYYIAWPTGTTYEIKDIRTTTGHGYNGVSSGSLKGAIGTNDIAVELNFSTLTLMSIKSVEVSGSTITVNWTPSSDSRVTKYEIYIIKNYSGDLKPKGEFSFSTQSFWEAGVTETSHSFDNIPDGAYPILIQAVGDGIIVEQLFSETVVVHATPIVHFDRTERYTQGQFSDVPANPWFTSNVADAFELGLMKGNSTSTFNPYGDVTVAEAITMAARIHSIYTAGTENIKKASGNTWYQPYLDYAYENGIITTAFYNSDVTQKATRAQFAEIFANALPDEGLSVINSIRDNSIPDVSISEAYAQYVYKLYRAGILIGGDANGTFSPLTYITRAEAAAIVSRMADTDERVSFRL